ncbi:MAG: radical SAM protein [Elusimicrobiota bacterium]
MVDKADFILLCYSSNTPYSYDAHTPLSILALGTYLEKHGVEVEYYDERIDSRRRFAELAARKPRAAGFSVIGGYQIASAARLSKELRRTSPGTRIVWGGVAPTSLPEETLRESYVDYAVLGEGEATLLELYRALGTSDAAAAVVPGIAFRGKGRIERSPARPPLDIETLPFVYQGKAVEILKRYIQRGSIREAVGYEASRGCAFHCGFCYSPHFHRGTRTKSLAKVTGELAKLKAIDAKDLDIYDDTFFGGKLEDFPAFLELLEKGRFTWIGNFRINMLDVDLLRRLEDSGCKWVYFGIESDDDETLAAIKKGVTASEIHAGIRLMAASKLPAVYSLIYGLPLEREKDSAARTLDFAEEIHRLHPSAEIQVQSYVPLPGSALYEEALHFGFKPPSRLDGWAEHDHFGVTNPWLTDSGLPAKIYLTSFLAFRYQRHLSHFPLCLFAYPLHKLSLWRVRKRTFGLYFEKILYAAALAAAKALTALRHTLCAE